MRKSLLVQRIQCTSDLQEKLHQSANRDAVLYSLHQILLAVIGQQHIVVTFDDTAFEQLANSGVINTLKSISFETSLRNKFQHGRIRAVRAPYQ